VDGHWPDRLFRIQ